MGQFLGLPNEVLVAILEKVGPESIEQVALSCKRVYGLAGKSLRKHVQMKQKYGIVEFCQDGDCEHDIGGPCVHLAPFLCDVLGNDEIAFYTQAMIVSTMRRPSWARRDRPRVEEHYGEIFRDVQGVLRRNLRQCTYLNDSEKRTFGEKIVRGNNDAILAFLVTLLPNLRAISVFPEMAVFNRTDWVGLFYDMVLRIAKASSSSEPAVLSPALSKLSALELPNELIFDDIASINTLPGLSSTRVTGDSCFHRFAATFKTGIFGFQSIHLRHTRVTDDSLIGFLSCIKSLERFIYRNGNPDFQPRMILTALSTHAGHSLTQLSLTTSKLSCNAANLYDFYFGSLSNFRSLTKLVVDKKVFFKPATSTITGTIAQGTSDSFVELLDQNYTVQRLIDMLPESLETCHLSGERTKDADLEALMAGLPRDFKHMRLPHLRELVHDNYIPGRRPRRSFFMGFDGT